MDRRSFIKVCAAAATMAGIEARYMGTLRAETRTYQRARLVDGAGNPVKAGNLSAAEAYIFHYPYRGTPCFLVRLPGEAGKDVSLDTEAAGSYQWPGGVGPGGSVVAYSAICAHQLAYPSKSGSAIRYAATKSEAAGRSGVIVCCAHNSVYDPAHGARVLRGQATEPLAAVALEHDPVSDELFAVGMMGAEKFDEFFRAYKRELIEAYGPGVSRQESTEQVEVVPLSAYAGSTIEC